MRDVEALKILESATADYETRSFATPEVREALDVVPPGVARVIAFCQHLTRHEAFGCDGEGQQQTLRVYFSGIYQCVGELLSVQIAKLDYRYRKTKDATVKGERDRFTTELAGLPERTQGKEDTALPRGSGGLSYSLRATRRTECLPKAGLELIPTRCGIADLPLSIQSFTN